MPFNKSNGIVSEWIKRIISLSVFLIPVLYISKITLYPFISLKSLALYFFIEVIFFLWLYAFLVKKEVVFRFNVVTASVLILIFVIALSSFFGVDSSLSFWSNFERMNGVLTWLHLGALFVVASSVLDTNQDWKHLFWVNSFAATIVSIIALLGRDGFGIISISEKGGSLLGNTSFVGSYLLMSFFLMAYLWIKKYKNRGFLMVMMLIILIGPVFFGAKIWSGKALFLEIFSDPMLFLGRARAATIALYAGFGTLALGGVFISVKNKLVKNISKIALLIMATLAVSVFVMFFVKGSPVQSFISETASKSRVGAWEISVEAWKTRPFLGYGIGNFSYIYQDFYNPLFLTKEYGNETWMDKAHSVGYETLATMGVLGVSSLVFVYTSVGIFLYRKRKDDDFDFWTALIPVVLLSAHLVQNLTVFDTVTTYQMFILVLAFVASQRGKEISISRNFWREGIGQVFVGFGLVASLIFFVFIPYTSAHSTLEFSKGEFIGSQQEIDNLFNKINITKIGEIEKIKLLSELWREQIVKFPQILARYPENVIYVQDKFLETMKISLIDHPDDLRTHITISRMDIFSGGMLSGKDGDVYFSDAKYHAQKAVNLSPNSQMALWTLAVVENTMGNREEAYRLAKTAYDFAPTAKTAAAVLAQYE